jgi:uncharacterized protein (TIGR01777 family)
MKILFSGATGFIGQCFIRHFKQHDYTILTRSARPAIAQSANNIQVINDLAALESLNAFDAVINLAGEPIIDKRWSDKQKRRICQSRWQTTQTLVDLIAVSTKPPEVFISGSAIGFYGAAGAAKLTEQDEPKSTDFAHQICAKWEGIASEAAVNTRVVLLRTGIVLGDGGALAKMRLPFKLGLGGRIGDGYQYMSWIHIEDMILAIDFLLNHSDATGFFNLTAPHALNNQAFTNTLAHVLDTKARLPLPEKLLRLLMGESADLLLNSQNVYPENLLKIGFEFEYPELEVALRDLLG